MYGKVAGLLMLVFGFSGAGFTIASNYYSRARELAEARTTLALLETEICCSLRPLGPALLNAAAGCRGPAGTLFRRTASELAEGVPAAVAWRRGVEQAMNESALTRSDADVLASLGLTLGVSTAEDQRRHLRSAIERLSIQESEARDRQSREGKLWRYAGVFGGLALAALLF
ncbi:MAG: hypothetical protein ACM3X4_09175 [Ignavibacteriales bacterium]